MTREDIIRYALDVFGYLLNGMRRRKDRDSITGWEFGDIIKSHYDTSNPKTYAVVSELRKGNIVIKL